MVNYTGTGIMSETRSNIWNFRVVFFALCTSAICLVVLMGYYSISVHPIVIVNSEGGGSGTWYNMSSEKFRFYAYSAFYDSRPSLLSTPVIRIIAISDHFEKLKKSSENKSIIYCYLSYGDRTALLGMKDDPLPVGNGWPLNRQGAREYVYTCPTEMGKIPHSVGITTSGNLPSVCVPVTLPRKPSVPEEFCVCVQVAYGNLEPYRLIEWLELLKLLGVSLVGVYNLSISEPALGILRHYSKEGFVDLHPTKEIYHGDDRHYLLQGSPVINDCMYRHMHEFRRMLVIDFDEFIMPRKHENLSQLVSYLDKELASSPHVNYAFRNNYFFLDLPPDETVSPQMTVLRYRKKVAVSPDGYSIKSIINPQACTHMHNHYCWGVAANYSKYGNTASVDPEIALNHHYKRCHFSKESCNSMFKNTTQDDIMLRFKDILVRRVNEKLEIIGLTKKKKVPTATMR